MFDNRRDPSIHYSTQALVNLLNGILK